VTFGDSTFAAAGAGFVFTFFTLEPVEARNWLGGGAAPRRFFVEETSTRGGE
jgi:hypothetical protein